jgi:23S rRNA pseudouridine1911/1915/1917 synthase
LKSAKKYSAPHAEPGAPDAALAGEDAVATDEAADEAADAAVELRDVLIGAQDHDDRLDRALARHIAEFSRSYLQQLLADGAVQLQGQAVRKPAMRVRAGQTFRVELRATPQALAFTPEAMDLRVVFEDAHLLVIDKPAGLVVHPAPGNWRGTLLNGLLARDPACAQLPRAGIVHRLDKDTSGLMVVARTRVAMEALVRMIAARSVTRQYLAIARGPWRGGASRDVSAAIGRDPANRLRMAALDERVHPAKPASTLIEFGAGNDRLCWVQCSLRTGRTHQIRVHMAAIGHPLVGDSLYGGPPGQVVARQALHAWRLAFRHPVTGAELDFRTDWPADLRAELDAAGVGYNLPEPAGA